jgi:hypothetical protein
VVDSSSSKAGVRETRGGQAAVRPAPPRVDRLVATVFLGGVVGIYLILGVALYLLVSFVF